jgi:hypothetical protein
MPRLEPWRLQELALLVDELVTILRSGKNPEWANVFVHFADELKLLGPREKGDGSELSRLIPNIRSCLSRESGLSRLVLEGKDARDSGSLNLHFGHLKARLKKALDDLQERLVEYVS